MHGSCVHAHDVSTILGALLDSRGPRARNGWSTMARGLLCRTVELLVHCCRRVSEWGSFLSQCVHPGECRPGHLAGGHHGAFEAEQDVP
jgi:hypothetical protein